MGRVVSIGNASFAKIRENHCFYIDKTGFIKDWWESKDEVTLITRPRRFGKTLNMDMVDCFFSTKYADRFDLFEGLQIWEEEKYRSMQGTWPVIFLSFASIKNSDFESARQQLNSAIFNAFQDFRFLLDSDRLCEQDKRYFRSIDRNMTIADAVDAVNSLCRWLFLYYGKKQSSFWTNTTHPCRKLGSPVIGMRSCPSCAISLMPLSKPIHILNGV